MSKKATIPPWIFIRIIPTSNGWCWLLSVLISIGSIYYTDMLVDQLKERERQQVQLYAKAIEYTANDDELRRCEFYRVRKFFFRTIQFRSSR